MPGASRRELITEDELLRALREQGVEAVAEVKAAYMENDGRISVIMGEGRRPGLPAGSWRA